VVIAALVIGLYPRPFFGAMDKSSADLAAHVSQYAPATTAQTANITAQEVGK
jgi:hypothetical protein